MFGKKEQPLEPNPVEKIDMVAVRKAEDASEILYGLARLVEANGNKVYTEQIRNAAKAIIEFTELHSGHPTDYQQDYVMGAGEHASQIRHVLRLNR
jgi:hypothetical protein